LFLADSDNNALGESDIRGFVVRTYERSNVQSLYAKLGVKTSIIIREFERVMSR